MENHVETVTLDSEISMSIAATDDTREMARRDRSRYVPPRGRSLGRGAVLTDRGFFENAPPKRLLSRLDINVEPTLFLMSVCLGLVNTMQSLFLYWARCVEIFSNSTAVPENVHNVSAFCSQLSSPNYTVYQDKVERDISATKTFLQVASCVPTLLTAPVIAAWSDGRGGRRRPLLISLAGLTGWSCLQFAGSLSYASINVYYFMFAAEVCVGCLGGFATLFMASLAIVTDQSRDQLVMGSSSVPLRIGIAGAVQSSGFLVGNLLASMCTVRASVSIAGHVEGYVRAFAIALAVAVAAFLYTALFVRETHAKDNELETSFIATDRYSIGSMSDQSTSRSIWKFLRALAYDLVSVILERRPGWTRFCLNVSICFVFVELLALDNQLLFLLTKRYPFEWSDTTFANYSTLKSFLTSVGMVLMPLLVARSSCLGKDSFLIMAGILASSVAFLINSFAKSTAILFAASSFALVAGAISPGYRSFLPRMVAKEETARLFAVFSFFMMASPIFSAALFNSVFNATMDVWPGFAFFVGAILQLFVLAGQLVIHCLMRPQWAPEEHDGRRRETSSTRTASDGLTPDGGTVTSQRSLSNTAVNSEPDSGDTFEEPRRPLVV